MLRHAASRPSPRRADGIIHNVQQPNSNTPVHTPASSRLLPPASPPAASSPIFADMCNQTRRRPMASLEERNGSDDAANGAEAGGSSRARPVVGALAGALGSSALGASAGLGGASALVLAGVGGGGGSRGAGGGGRGAGSGGGRGGTGGGGTANGGRQVANAKAPAELLRGGIVLAELSLSLPPSLV